MLSAVFGDIAGSVYEFDNARDPDFPLLTPWSKPTDDSIMTLAVANALMQTWEQNDDKIRAALVHSMQELGKRYPYAGYGGMFRAWLHSSDPQPYGSFGNGSAMRVASVGWLYPTLSETLHTARLTAEVTHNHPEGIKGAQAVAGAIFLARTGMDKKQIADFITNEFGYDVSCPLAEQRPHYAFYETCQQSVPQAVRAFLEATDYESAVRGAIWLGGDSDTIACIAGAIAEAFYPMPRRYQKAAYEHLDAPLRKIAYEYHTFYHQHSQGN